jgi:hypothetical protein
VSTRAFFGFTALYSKERIFALLPRTRGMVTANSLAFKLEAITASVLVQAREGPSHRIEATAEATRWFSFEVPSSADLRDALYWLVRTHAAVGKSIKRQ